VQKVAKASEIPVGGAKVVAIDGGRTVAIFKVKEGELYAIENICPHQGASLGEGYLDGTTVTCPWHAWEFDVRTGKCGTVPQNRIKSYKIKLNGDDILLQP
jgi:NAD(P)H-dependent nitrite reductase small subunit